ncbi:DNA ligase 1 isoform X1 [Maniola hyperantus]|uniref:DNA ligase 1 isoform X1 n=2 Tax=Aphantopus hyperantus TaxID=2795564 RepID=UPI00374A4E59
MNTIKLLFTRRIVFSPSNRSLFTTAHTLHSVSFTPSAKRVPTNVLLSLRRMSQKSITSFFNITPKAKVKKENKDEPTPSSDTPSSNETTPVNGNDKKMKRSRSSSSDDEMKHEKCLSPGSSSKKKKTKRQRIESSESESGSPAKPGEEDKLTEVKLQKAEKPKTYKKPKAKTKKNDAENKIKEEQKSPSPKKSPKKEGKKSSMVNSYFTVKVEKKEGDSKSNGVEKENVENSDNTVAEVDYNPAKAKYHPIDDACWSKGQAIPYLALAKTLEAIEATSARLKMVEILSNYLRSVMALTPEDLLPSIYLCLNQLAPAYHSLELGIAETYLMKAVGQCTGRTLAQMRAAAHSSGDLGRVAETARATQRTMFAPPPLSVRRVLAALREVAVMTGQASVNKKISKIQSLYVACRHSEARYLIRSLEGKLRIGLAEQSLLQALALACAATPPAGEGAGSLNVAADMGADMGADKFKARVDEYALVIKTTYCECPNYELIVPVLLQHGVRALPAHCRLTPGIPLKPMLAHPTKGVHEVFNRFEKEVFTCEWKYDGERAQIHVPGDDAPRLGDAAIYSRNQENNTSKYPDVLKRLPSLLKETVRSCVLDCEAVAYDTASRQILPFQVLSTRKRKDAAEEDIKVQVCVFVFDLLFLNGRALVRDPLEDRRRLLREHFNEVEGSWQMAVGRDCGSEEEVQQFLEEAVKGSCEGLMVKALRGDHSRYDIARRSHNWLKLKKDYLDGVGDTIDAVVVGAYHGRGKRAGVYGGFLLACYDAASEQYQSLCKIGTGFSDDDLKALSELLAQHVIDAPRNYYMYSPSHEPDVWLSAACVLEVRCADLSLSPAHRAAIGLLHPDKGVSLRFPRFIRIRDDKSPEQATSAQQIAQLYAAQDQVKNSSDKHKPRDFDDFY